LGEIREAYRVLVWKPEGMRLHRGIDARIILSGYSSSWMGTGAWTELIDSG